MAGSFAASRDQCRAGGGHVGEPPVEAGGAQAGARPRHQRAVLDRDAEIGRRRIGDHTARVLVEGQHAGDQFVDPEGHRAGDFQYGVGRRSERSFGDGRSDVLRGHRLEMGRRKADIAAHDREPRDAPQELEELGGVYQRIGLAGIRDQLLLGKLGAEIAAILQPIGADNRERNMMPDTRRLLGSSDIAARGLEEIHRRLIVEGRRVRDVDDDFGAFERPVEAFAGKRVDTRIGCGREYVMALPREERDRFRSDQAGASDDDDLHERFPLVVSNEGKIARLGRLSPSCQWLPDAHQSAG
jgi:hypothetical protein